VLSSTRISRTRTTTTGTADTLFEVGRFLLEARAASRRAAGTARAHADVRPRPRREPPVGP